MLEGIQDVLLIALFLSTLIVIALLIVLILQIMQLVRLIRGEVTPLVGSVRRTASTVRGTAEFVGDTAVVPIVRVASALAAINRFVRAWLGLSRR
jgi:hypothetical protein